MAEHQPAAEGSIGMEGNRISVNALGWALGVLLVVSYTVCVAWDLAFPAQAMHQAWEGMLPWFTWIDWPSYFVGLVESFAYGWWVAIIVAPVYNFVAARS
jgi:hypothetical protein